MPSASTSGASRGAVDMGFPPVDVGWEDGGTDRRPMGASIEVRENGRSKPTGATIDIDMRIARVKNDGFGISGRKKQKTSGSRSGPPTGERCWRGPRYGPSIRRGNPGAPDDRGHVPVKLLGFQVDPKTGKWDALSGVKITLGPPIIRASVDHGTAFDSAGKGIANEFSLIEAIDYAEKLAAARLARPRT